MKPSRIDLCADILLPVVIWSPELMQDMVCRADSKGLYFYKKQLSGISIGKGKISARLYDKPLEIRTKSQKDWMFDIWGLHDIPKDKRVIRVEYQMRREMIVEIGLKHFHDLLKFKENLWAYCTQKWLKFQSRTDKHHSQRKILPWWLSVQSGFQGIQAATPLIRGKAYNRDLKMYNSQAMGALTSLAATHMEMNNDEIRQDMDLYDCLGALYDAGDLAKERGLDFGEVVNRKRAKHARKEQAFAEVLYKRRGQGFPSGL